MTANLLRAPGARRKILHLSAGNLYGGVESFLVTLGRHGGQSEMQPTFGFCFEGRVVHELRALGADVELLGAARFSRPWSVLRSRRNLQQLLKQRAFDAVVCHSEWPHALFAPVAARAGLPLAYWAHNPPSSGWLETFAGWTAPDLVITNSQFTRSEHHTLFAGARTVVVRYPVPPPNIVEPMTVRADVRREFDTPADDVVIVCSSRLEAWKGHQLLVDALSKLRALDGWTAWIAGAPQRTEESAYFEDLVSRVSGASLTRRVRFIGERKDIPRVLAAADIHCQPNMGPEPFGIAFIEALYAGLPVVTTAIGAAPEIVTADCGILVPVEASALAGALRKLIVEHDARRSLSRSGPHRAAALCDPTHAVPAIAHVLTDLVDGGAAPSARLSAALIRT